MPKPIRDQVVVITGASSGIGRATALEFARLGARLVLAARNEPALQELAEMVKNLGAQALVVPTDVAESEQVNRLARAAVREFGRIDCWINNAGVTEYATVEKTEVEEFERIIQVNLLGQVYGVKAALPYLKQQAESTIINVSSVLGERAVPLQAAYVASKHGVKGFTDALRMELKHEKTGINVTLIAPASINTPLFEHAPSKMGVKPRPIPPVYSPQQVAQAIVQAANHPRREVVVGGGGKLLLFLARLSPALVDWLMLWRGLIFRQQQTDLPPNSQDNLFAPLNQQDNFESEQNQVFKIPGTSVHCLKFYPSRKQAFLDLMHAELITLFRRENK
jgi:short-subunit dehydrogenase